MSDHERIRVFIVDDHDMVRRGLAAFLLAFPDLELVGEAANGKDALRLCIQVQPDIVLMDLMLPEMDGATATRELRRQYPAIQVIALTSFHQADMVRDVLQAGAIGYLLKNASADELAVAIRAAYAGRPTLAPEATQVLLRAATQQDSGGLAQRGTKGGAQRREGSHRARELRLARRTAFERAVDLALDPRPDGFVQ